MNQDALFQDQLGKEVVQFENSFTSSAIFRINVYVQLTTRIQIVDAKLLSSIKPCTTSGWLRISQTLTHHYQLNY